jgi:formate dehydrogenase major subunit
LKGEFYMRVTRRDFLKISGASAGTFALVELGFNVAPALAQIDQARIKNIKGIPTICPFCGAGCGLLAFSVQDPVSKKFVQLLSVEGDPDHPVNLGGACPKGAGIFQLRQVGPDYIKDVNPKRIQKPRYRAAGSDKWEEKEWNWVLDEIAKKIKDNRDKNLVATQELEVPVVDASTGKPMLDAGGKTITEKKTITVNRNEAMASLGGAALDNEEAYLQSKMMRSLGIVFLEHQARI